RRCAALHQLAPRHLPRHAGQRPLHQAHPAPRRAAGSGLAPRLPHGPVTRCRRALDPPPRARARGVGARGARGPAPGGAVRDWDPVVRMRLLFLDGLTVYGVAGTFSFYLPELFPTRLRGTGAGFCYNAGRYLAAAGPFVVGRALGAAPTPMDAIRWMALVPLVGLVLVPFIVETGPSATVWLPLRLGRRWPCRPNGRPPSPPPCS